MREGRRTPMWTVAKAKLARDARGGAVSGQERAVHKHGDRKLFCFRAMGEVGR